MEDLEGLGVFYLGRLWDAERQAATREPLLYASKDLTTHAVCVGMTGSGKTGLGIALLEEAALDGVPALVIDPKGDLGNLALAFPALSPADFAPWIDPAEAERAGRTPAEHAAETAARWRAGLAEWGQTPERLARLREAAEVAIYTPGSTAGRPLSVLGTLAAPAPPVRDDLDALRERIGATVSSLLTLIGIDSDPIRGREHLLLATLLDRAWTAGGDLDLGTLVRQVASPPLERIGVLDLESFYPARERETLAHALNGLLASPSFAAWTTGEPLDVARLLWTPDGRPRLSVLSIAHLSDAERMFFVTLLLGEIVTWMRAQPGTSSLRALVYMDEIFGYFPPSANPPSKPPMLTLLKQARAFGLGVVLATQNPVDLDYKGLSNAGTWFLGRLQTERDKARVLDGLEGASVASMAGFDRATIERTLSSLPGRVFLMHDVHEDRPVLFQSRWVMSYLRGPLTRVEIRALCSAPGVSAPARSSPGTEVENTGARPVLAAGISELHLAAAGSAIELYRPALLATARLHWVDAKCELDRWDTAVLLVPLYGSAAAVSWDGARLLEGEPALDPTGTPSARYEELPAPAARPERYGAWSRELSAWLYRERRLVVWRAARFGAVSQPGEDEGAFRIRLGQAARERRDAELARLEKRWAPKLAALRERIRRAEERVERERAQYEGQRTQAAISVGATVLGALFGRRLAGAGTVGRVTTAARGASRAARERGDVGRAAEAVEAEREKLEAAEAELAEETRRLRDEHDPSTIELAPERIAPRKSDVTVERLALAWTPWGRSAVGTLDPLWASASAEPSAGRPTGS